MAPTARRKQSFTGCLDSRGLNPQGGDIDQLANAIGYNERSAPGPQRNCRNSGWSYYADFIFTHALSTHAAFKALMRPMVSHGFDRNRL
jgi:hypothetical protein